MRAIVIAALVAAMGYGLPTLAQQQSAASSNAGQMTNRSAKEVAANKDADSVRTRNSYSSLTVSEVHGRR